MKALVMPAELGSHGRKDITKIMATSNGLERRECSNQVRDSWLLG